MSKSLGNAIFLSDPPEVIAKKVMSMYTDPHAFESKRSWRIEGNTVFAYLDIFDPNEAEVKALKEHYQRGGLGDVVPSKKR